MGAVIIIAAAVVFYLFGGYRKDYSLVEVPLSATPPVAPVQPVAPFVASPKVVELPVAAPAKPAAEPDANTAANLTGAEKAQLTRQALAARGPAPKFSSAVGSALTPANVPSALEQRVMDMLADAPSSIDYKQVDIFELDPGTVSSYHLRDEVVRIPIMGTGPRFNYDAHNIFYLPSVNHFYIVWEGMGASTLHYHGPFEGNPYDMLGIPQPAKVVP